MCVCLCIGVGEVCGFQQQCILVCTAMFCPYIMKLYFLISDKQPKGERIGTGEMALQFGSDSALTGA